MVPPGCQASAVFGRLPVIRAYYRSIVFHCQGGFTVQSGCWGSRHQVQIPGRRVKGQSLIRVSPLRSFSGGKLT